MSSIVLVDTSILLNVVDVPGLNQQRTDVLAAFSERIDNGDHLFIPIAAIIETGNHISHLADGRLRRQAAERFVKEVRAALNDEAPWKPLNMPSSAELSVWLIDFPESAMRQVGMGDLSIQKEWAQLCKKNPMSRVLVWRADAVLQGFDHIPKGR